MLSEHTECYTQALFPGETVLACAARQTRIEDDLGSELDTRNPVTHRIDHTCTIGATDVRKPDRYSRYPVEDKEIEMVEGGGLQPNPDLTWSRLGIGPITIEQFVSPTVLFKIEGFHITSCAATL
jgi:hypothetical protein